jgi:hypothetical protein
MRPVRNREHRRRARALSTGNTHLLHQVPFGHDPIVLSAGGYTTPSPGLSPAFFGMGPAIIIFFVWTVAGVSSIYEHPMTSALRPSTVTVFLFLGAASLVGMAFSLRSITRYNREVYPRLHWNWEHTYICRRCGRFRLIPS